MKIDKNSLTDSIINEAEKRAGINPNNVNSANTASNKSNASFVNTQPRHLNTESSNNISNHYNKIVANLEDVLDLYHKKDIDIAEISQLCIDAINLMSEDGYYEGDSALFILTEKILFNIKHLKYINRKEDKDAYIIDGVEPAYLIQQDTYVLNQMMKRYKK